MALSSLFWLLLSSISGGDIVVPMKPEEPGGYAGNPSTIKAPMRQDLTVIVLTPRADGKYDVRLGDGAQAARMEAVDFALWVPRVPKLCGQDPVLLRLALIQREFNRNELQLGPVQGADDLRIANNCLKRGLWETMLVTKEGDKTLLGYHGWFEFPKDVYADLFQKQNGIAYPAWAVCMDAYPDLNGFAVPLEKLRKVDSEHAAELTVHSDEPIAQLSEQKRKAKLLLTPELHTYADFAKKEKQPIRTAIFAEPGWYDTAHPMSFDLTWLAAPKEAIARKVHGVSQDAAFDELELRFADGRRILIADQKIATLEPRTAPPAAEADVLKLTFGIGTPDIYSTAAARAQELTEGRPSYLLMLDKDGKNIDNHLAGVDRAYLWREAGTPGRLHVLLVGYERIALVSHLSIPFPQ